MAKRDRKIQCELCNEKPMYARNMKKHIMRKHSSLSNQHTNFCKGVMIDRNFGVGLASENRCGVQYPIHAHTWYCRTKNIL